MVGLGDGGKSVVAGGLEAIEAEAIFPEDFWGDFVWGIIVGNEFGGLVVETLEVEAVILNGLTATAMLDFEGFEEIIDKIQNIHGFIISQI